MTNENVARISYLRKQIEVSELLMAALGSNFPNNPDWNDEYDNALNHAVSCKIELDELQCTLDTEFSESE